ncbi:protein kinase [bacterium]|nr:protein kinase [bacterium]
MLFQKGTKLGPYELLTLIGAGGMGEVYRARDPRLGREVGIKVLLPMFSSDPDRLRRFDQESRAAGLLNHPNVLAIYDVGLEAESPYLVTELLEGENLRKSLARGPIPQHKALEYAIQIANGVTAAHEKGIVHRDLKPENIFITRDDRIKILDFGLAKLIHINETENEEKSFSAIETQTRTGILIGTVGYMSPEQVRGLTADKRSDIFSVGAILYEMLLGKRAFEGSTTVETLNAVLKEEPCGLIEQNENFSAALQGLVRSCLEKNPDDRFESVRDLAVALDALSTSSGFIRKSEKEDISTATADLTFQRITYRHGYIWSARFAPDGSTIVYGASWNGEPCKLFLTRAEASESLPLALPDADILSISSKGQMAISLGRQFDVGYVSSGTLAHLPITGGAPREVLEDIQDADWTIGGEELVVVRRVEGQSVLEFPAGHAIFKTNGWIKDMRLSRDGKFIAFAKHPFYGDDSGSIVIIDNSGNVKVSSDAWNSIQGIAWSADGTEVWFASTNKSADRALYATSLSGKLRTVFRAPVGLQLHDISSAGHVLFSRSEQYRRMVGLFSNRQREFNLTALNWSVPRVLSSDGEKLLFVEQGGPRVSNKVFIRKTDGSPAVQIGEGLAMDISPDWKWALTLTDDGKVILLPAGAGKEKDITYKGLNYSWAAWFPDGKKILFSAAEAKRPQRLYVQELTGSAPVPITEEGAAHFDIFMTSRISPDGKFVTGWNPDRILTIFSVEGDKQEQVLDVPAGHNGVSWSSDGNSLYTADRTGIPAVIYRLNLKTGKREICKEIYPDDPAGIHGISPIVLTPDLKSIVYSYRRVLSDLYLVAGLK